MPDYKEMYTVLFQNVSKAISLLQDAQKETEELYISSDDMNLRILSDKDMEVNPIKYPKRKKHEPLKLD